MKEFATANVTACFPSMKCDFGGVFSMGISCYSYSFQILIEKAIYVV